MQSVDVGDRILHARVEAYSCKLAGADKRAAKEITHAVEHELQHSSPHHLPHAASVTSMTSLGDLREPATRQLLVSLITTLNASFPDYDFSTLRAEQFEREGSAQAIINAVNSLFVNAMESSLGVTGFRDEFWSALEETIFLHECEIYKYEPSLADSESAGQLWALNLFFFHRKLKKMVLLSGEAVSKLHLQNAHVHAYQQHARARQAHLASSGTGAAGGAAMGVDDDSDFESDSSSDEETAAGGSGASGNASGALTSQQLAQQDAEDDAMEAAEEQMLEELAAEQAAEGLAPPVIAGSYVDASLLEWDQPLVPAAMASSLMDGGGVPASYVSSPSASSIASSSTASTVRVGPLPASFNDNTMPPPPPMPMSMQTSPFARSLSPHMHSPQIRLASTKSPTMRPAVPAAASSSFTIAGVPQVGAAHAAIASGSSALPPSGQQGVSLFGGSRSSFSAPSAAAAQQPPQPHSSLPAVPPFSSS